MTDKILAQQIAVLGRLCGIMPGFQDNRGRRHRTSQATYKALLTAMGVTWENPDVLRMEIERRQTQLFDQLLQAVTVMAAASPPNALAITVHTPEPQPPPDLRARVELTAENGQSWSWESSLKLPAKPEAYPVARGFRTHVELPLPLELESGYYDLKLQVQSGSGEETGTTLLLVIPETAYLPPCLAAGRRLWGFNLPLYALTSAHNWGIGDFTDLREMISWAGELGAAFVGVNPLHAPMPQAQADPSPYSPTSRLFTNFWHLDLEEVPELAESPAAQALLASPEFQAAKAHVRSTSLVAYPEIFRLKRQILGPVFETFLELQGGDQPRSARGQEFARFIKEADELLRKFAEFSALVEHWGEGDWRRWPPEYHHPHSSAVAGFSHEHHKEVLFHQFVQWLAGAQLSRAKQQAYDSGLPFTLYQDLALGATPGGFETWAYPGLFAQGVSIGAPPDAFNPKGQDWDLPPMIPEHLRKLRFQPFIHTLRANLPVDGMLRLDHVMALFRLFWIPHIEKRAAGTYVKYPARELLAILALESQRRRTLIIGEDLGTVAPHIRRELKKKGIFSYRVFYFERNRNCEFREPENYPRQAMAAVTTHDLPTLAGFWEGRDLKVKQALHLYPQEQMAAMDARGREQDRDNLLKALSRQRLLPDVLPARPVSGQTCPEEIRLGVLEYLGKSATALLEIRLEDVFGLSDQQNLPGTTTQYPNWKRKIPLSLSQMREAPEPRRLASRMARCSRKCGTKTDG
jgi:4-alpha-glucanotransferase